MILSSPSPKTSFSSSTSIVSDMVGQLNAINRPTQNPIPNKLFIHFLDFCTIASDCSCFLDGKRRKRGKKTLCKSQELLLSIQSIFKAKQILLNVVDIYKISNELSLKKVDFISIKFIFQQFFWVIFTWDYNELLLYLNLWIGLLNGEQFCDKKRKSKYFFFGLQIIF